MNGPKDKEGRVEMYTTKDLKKVVDCDEEEWQEPWKGYGHGMSREEIAEAIREANKKGK